LNDRIGQPGFQGKKEIENLLTDSAAFVLKSLSASKNYQNRTNPDRLEIIAQAYTSACATTTNATIYLLLGGFIFEAAILSRSFLESASKAWVVLLANENGRSSLLADFESLIPAEARRKRGSIDALNNATPESNQALQFMRDLAKNPEDQGLSKVSDTVMKRIVKRFKYGNLLQEIEVAAKDKGMPVDFALLRFHYAHSSDYSHVNASALITLEQLTKIDSPNKQTIGDSSVAGLCGLCVLVWYYTQCFWALYQGSDGPKEHAAFSEAQKILHRVKAKCDVVADDIFG